MLVSKYNKIPPPRYSKLLVNKVLVVVVIHGGGQGDAIPPDIRS